MYKIIQIIINFFRNFVAEVFFPPRLPIHMSYRPLGWTKTEAKTTGQGGGPFFLQNMQKRYFFPQICGFLQDKGIYIDVKKTINYPDCEGKVFLTAFPGQCFGWWMYPVFGFG